MRQISITVIVLLAASLAVLLLTGCAADGGLASKSKPFDKEQTRLALCDGAQKVDIAWHTISSASTVIPAQASDVEAAFITTVGFTPGSPAAAGPNTFCSKQYTGDLDVAINTVILATVNISKLIQAWNQK